MKLCQFADLKLEFYWQDSVSREDLNPLCQTLEVLLLDNTHVRAKGAAFVLRVVPNLTSLGDFGFLAAGLQRLYGLRSYPWAGRKLKHVLVCLIFLERNAVILFHSVCFELEIY